MNRFSKPSLKEKLRSVFPTSIVAFVLVILLFLYGISSVSKSQVLDERKLLEDAIVRDISHCYAVEGSYPPSLHYMQEHYGLTYDQDKFLVNYEYIGSNIMPTFYILER